MIITKNNIVIYSLDNTKLNIIQTLLCYPIKYFDLTKIASFFDRVEMDPTFLSKLKYGKNSEQIYIFLLIDKDYLIDKDIDKHYKGFALGYIDVLNRFQIISLATEEDNKGYGKTLIKGIIDILIEHHKCDYIYGYTDIDNNRAKELYNKFADTIRNVNVFEKKLF